MRSLRSARCWLRACCSATAFTAERVVGIRAARRLPAAARPGGLRADPGRAADPARAPAGALGDQAAVPSASAGVFGFDLFLYADAMLFGMLDPDIWVARGVANCIVIPFLAVATARNTGWTIDMHVSRGAVFHSTALAGVRRVPARRRRRRILRPLLRRRLGTRAADRAAVRRDAARGRLIASSGRFRSQAQGVRQQAFLLVSLRLPRGVAALHAHALDRKPDAGSAGAYRSLALADLVESPAGALWLREEDRSGFVPAARWNMPAIDARRARRRSARRVSWNAAGWVIELAETAQRARATTAGLRSPAWLDAFPSRLARRSARIGHGLCSASSSWRRRGPRSSSTGKCATC